MAQFIDPGEFVYSSAPISSANFFKKIITEVLTFSPYENISDFY